MARAPGHYPVVRRDDHVHAPDREPKPDYEWLGQLEGCPTRHKHSVTAVGSVAYLMGGYEKPQDEVTGVENQRLVVKTFNAGTFPDEFPAIPRLLINSKCFFRRAWHVAGRTHEWGYF